MNTVYQFLCSAVAMLLLASAVGAQSASIRVGDNRHFLISADGRPFFYLADTAWELFHRLNREDAEFYLRDRVDKHFNVIHAAILAEYGGLTAPNAYGHLPLSNNDPAKPNEDYFKDVDWIADKAASLGLYVGMLPTWGDKVNKKWGQGPEIFDARNAAVFGEFLGRRYRDKPIIWILGGDRPVENKTQRAIWQSMADGLRKGDGGAHLITFHPMGGRSSSEWFPDAPWLDFNLFQSGHAARDVAGYGMTWTDYQKPTTRPTVNGEPNYEDHPINWVAEDGFFNDFDVRKQAYWAVFAGACGHAYGCNDVWQFWQKGRDPVNQARTDWKQALKLPGASQMQYLKALIESRPMLVRVPDQSLLKSPEGKDGDHVQATRGSDGSYAMIYIPTARPVKVDLTKLSGPALKAWWFDPRDGSANPAGDIKNDTAQEFMPPAAEKNTDANDWILVVDTLAPGLLPPGHAH